MGFDLHVAILDNRVLVQWPNCGRQCAGPPAVVRPVVRTAEHHLNICPNGTLMESPQSWNLITSSLAVCDLRKPESTWAFLVYQHVVRDSVADERVFVEILVDEKSRGAITGPSVAARVACRLTELGITLPAGLVADPWGTVASQQLENHDPPRDSPG